MRIGILIAGFILFSLGWAVRSTVIMHSYENKPVGGIFITLGLLAMGWSVWRLFRK